MAVKSSKNLRILEEVQKENAYKEVTIKLEVKHSLAEKIEYMNSKMFKVLGVQPSKLYGKKFGEKDASFFEDIYAQIVESESESENKKSGKRVKNVVENEDEVDGFSGESDMNDDENTDGGNE